MTVMSGSWLPATSTGPSLVAHSLNTEHKPCYKFSWVDRQRRSYQIAITCRFRSYLQDVRNKKLCWHQPEGKTVAFLGFAPTYLGREYWSPSPRWYIFLTRFFSNGETLIFLTGPQTDRHQECFFLSSRIIGYLPERSYKTSLSRSVRKFVFLLPLRVVANVMPLSSAAKEYSLVCRPKKVAGSLLMVQSRTLAMPTAMLVEGAFHRDLQPYNNQYSCTFCDWCDKSR